MRSIISARTAGIMLLTFFAAALVFHVLILAGIVPSDIVWGGRAGSRSQLVVLESVSIGVLLLAAFIASACINLIQLGRFRKIAVVGAWVLFALFLLNTVGNLFARTQFERLAFTPVTLILSLLSLRLALD